MTKHNTMQRNTTNLLLQHQKSSMQGHRKWAKQGSSQNIQSWIIPVERNRKVPKMTQRNYLTEMTGQNRTIL